MRLNMFRGYFIHRLSGIQATYIIPESWEGSLVYRTVGWMKTLHLLSCLHPSGASYAGNRVSRSGFWFPANKCQLDWFSQDWPTCCSGESYFCSFWPVLPNAGCRSCIIVILQLFISSCFNEQPTKWQFVVVVYKRRKINGGITFYRSERRPFTTTSHQTTSEAACQSITLQQLIVISDYR